jgi:hypothetical protein
MKKLFLTLSVLAATAAGAFAQGTLIFANGTPTLITNNVTGQRVVNGAQVGLYVGASNHVGSLTLASVTPTITAPFAGAFNGGTVVINGFGAGTVIDFQVRAWLASTVYPSYEAAYASALGGDSTVLLGQSGVHNIELRVSPSPILSINNFGLEAIRLSPVPEPSSIALGLLGLGAVALFRRRK